MQLLFFFSYEWIVPIQWMKNGEQQAMYWLETKNSKQWSQTKDKNMLRFTLKKKDSVVQLK